MSWLRDTIAGRTILVLVVGLGSILALAQYLYQTGIEREVTVRNADEVVERLVVLTESIASYPPEKRDDAAHRMSGGPIELHWAREPLATPGGNLDEVTLHLRDRLLARAPRLGGRGLIVGSSRPEKSVTDGATDHNHITLISLPLEDGTWLNVSLARVQSTRASLPSAGLSILLGAIGVITLAALMGRWLTAPLDRLATSAQRLSLPGESAPLPATGTREVRTLAAAINDLLVRIRRLVDDRTGMLAAVSHDLRTPLTRLRLRAARLNDADARRSIETDLDEMEAMIDATLSFLRDDVAKEPVEAVDLVAILVTIANDATDAGHTIELQAPRSLVVTGRHLALKRALSNLVQNALKYGKTAKVTAALDSRIVRILIQDEGPGIPREMLETVFEPFYRLEASRGRSTGGHGLGLTSARSILRAHGGDVMLANGRPCGLEARVTLPAPAPAA